MATIVQRVSKLTRAKNKSEKTRATNKSHFITLLTLTISYVRSESMAVIPKKIPTLFQLPTIEEVSVVNRPKDKTPSQKIILINKNNDRIMAERTKAK